MTRPCRAPIRKERDRKLLKAMLVQGAESGPGVAADEAYFDSLRERIASSSEA